MVSRKRSQMEKEMPWRFEKRCHSRTRAAARGQASANPPDVQSYAKPPPVSVPAFTEVPLSVPAVAGLNLRRLILCRPSHDASSPAFFPTPSRDASTPSTPSYPSYDHRFPTLMDVTLVVGAREKGAACVDGTPPGYHWL
ncbi:pectin acetylesterase 5-like [Hordeum vulgare]|nr:pectin acetylesterase 5-like [Hordeum vulgare]